MLAAGVSLLAASGAGAATFCVGKPATCPGTNFATMQDAVVASNGNGDGEQDRIEVGSGTFDGPTTGTASPVDVVGEGTGATTISGVPGATTTLIVGGGTGVSSVSALQLTPDGNDSPALRLLSSSPSQPSSAFDLLVTGSAAPAGAVGVQLQNSATLRDSSVNMTVGAPSTAVTTQGGSVERTHLEGATGLIGTGTSRRLSIVAASVGARTAAVGGNLTLDQATIRMTAAGTALLVPSEPSPPNGPLSLTGTHVTAFGNGAGTGASVNASCAVFPQPGLSTTLRLRGTILRGFEKDRVRVGVDDCDPGPGNGDPAPALLETTYSIFDPAKTTESGSGGFFESGFSIPAGSLGTTNLNVDPMFVNPGGFDFHLAAVSPAIDAGDPSAPSSSESSVDLDGIPRVLDGNADAAARRDIGAYEFAPDTDGDGVPDFSDACPSVTAQTPDGCPEASDKTAPKITLGGKGKQKPDGTIEVRVRCDEACEVSGDGTLQVTTPSRGGGRVAAKRKRFGLRAARASLAAGETVVLKLKLTRKAKRATTRALRRRGRARARITVDATDAAGNAAEAGKGVRLATRRRR